MASNPFFSNSPKNYVKFSSLMLQFSKYKIIFTEFLCDFFIDMNFLEYLYEIIFDNIDSFQWFLVLIIQNLLLSFLIRNFLFKFFIKFLFLWLIRRPFKIHLMYLFLFFTDFLLKLWDFFAQFLDKLTHDTVFKIKLIENTN